MLLRGGGIRLVPFSPLFASQLTEWYFNDDYKDMWRHMPKLLSSDQLLNYDKVVGGDVFLVFETGKMNTTPVGLVQVQFDVRTNSAFYFSILLDKSYTDCKYAPPIMGLVMDHYFNRMGYRKMIMEVLASRQDIKKNLLGSGFIFEGLMHENAFVDGKYVDEARYICTAKFFNKRYKLIVDEWKKV